MSAWFLRNYLKDSDLAAITAAIGAAEQKTVGEIRVCIRHRRHWKERKLTLHQLTVAEFERLHMEQTRQRAGVLILLLFSERKFHIVGDKGIHDKAGDALWERITQTMSARFKQGQFREGIVEGVAMVGKELAEHFPKVTGDTNELANEVVVD